MFSTCIFCNKPLGRNSSLEAFPVGERLAFDPARGRLWVVCMSCERWNLSPLDERWEAIEQAERLYTGTRRRVSTDNIGLAKLPEGTTLVRIGNPQRPEFVAWRYGDQFGRRRTRAMLMAGGGFAAATAIVVGGATVGVAVGGFGWLFAQVGRNIVRGLPNTVVARVRVGNDIVDVRRRHLAESSIVPAEDGTLGLHLRFRNGAAALTGADAQRVASIVLPSVNRYGGRKAEVAEAVRRIEEVGDSERYLRHAAHASGGLIRSMTDGVSPGRARSRQREFNKYGLFSLPAPQRLALEMALHEDAERRAMEGELEELERVWRDAEEVAAIADNLLVPSDVDAQFRRLKGEA
ncbi:MAG: hypothetical protein IT361_12865 [Gemmatimonadaceae bacterium]|nr:hypothetical protein [Gemmatimonadaceae bacterium]